MQNTTNYNLNKPDGNDFAKIEALNKNFDIVDAKLKELEDNSDVTNIEQSIENLETQVATHLDDYTGHVPYTADSGTANAKVVTLNPAPTAYAEGMAIAFKNKTQNTGVVTINVNGLGAKAIVKSNGNALTSGNLKANSVYTLRYNGTSFFLQGEGGEYGTATASHVLSGYTIGTENGVVSGTIPSKSAATITPGTSNQTIAANQYLTGVQTILGDSDLVASNIKKGVNIFGVVGNVDVTSLGGMIYATGQVTATNTDGWNRFSVRGLAFTPKYVLARYKGSDPQNAHFAVYGNFVSLGDTYNISATAGNGGTPIAGVTTVSNGFDVQITATFETAQYLWIAFG